MQFRHHSHLSVGILASILGVMILGFLIPSARSDAFAYSITVFNQYNSNWDHPAIANITMPDLQILNGTIVVQGYCDPNDPYERSIHFLIDGYGGNIGCSALSAGQVSWRHIKPWPRSNL